MANFYGDDGDNLQGAGSVNYYGGDGNDLLSGGPDPNQLYGGQGNDAQLQELEVAARHRFQAEGAHPGDAEQILHDHRATDENAHVDGGGRQQRRQ